MAQAALRYLTLLGVLGGITLSIDAQPRLSGRVLDQSNYPLEDAVVRMQSLDDPAISITVTTVQDGEYAVEEIPDGRYWIEATRTGFIGVRYTPIHIFFPANIRRDFVLPVAPAQEGGVHTNTRLVGELIKAGRRLGHVNLCLFRNSEKSCVETNGLGQYFLTVTPGSYDVIISAVSGTLWKGHVELPGVGEYRNYIRLD